MELRNLRLLYIAQYAPAGKGEGPVPAIQENAVYSEYHYAVYQALQEVCPHIRCANNPSAIIEHHTDIDFVFSLLNRAPFRNSEIFVSSLCEYYGLPYMGARPNIRALAEDKQLAKMMACFCKIETPNWICFDSDAKLPQVPPFHGPFFVKPRFGASSKYIDENSICDTWETAKEQISFLQEKDIDIIVEEFIEGLYFSSPVYFVNGKPNILPPIKESSKLKGNVVTYSQKRKVQSGLVRSVETSPEIVSAISHASLEIAKYIAPIDYTRIDYIIDSNGKPNFLEFNVCCNLGIQSSFVMAAQSIGITQRELIHSILTNSLKQQGII